jgi:O-antigen ligase
MAGFLVYTVLSKSFKMTAFIGTATILFICMLAFTKIGEGNQMIRRMRTVFDKNDASAGARDANKAVMRKYMKDAPFGIGIGMKPGSMASNHKYYVMNTIPPDSEYVYIWIHTGIVGISIFLITTALMFLGASRIIMFKLTSSSLRGIGAGLACCFVSMQLGGYANQVLMQFPNCVVCYGGLSLVYILPFIEKEWLEYEGRLVTRQEEKAKLKAALKKAERV